MTTVVFEPPRKANEITPVRIEPSRLPQRPPFEEVKPIVKEPPLYTRVDRCRVCNRYSLEDILSLGEQYIVDFSTTPNSGEKAPLDLVKCTVCGLVQLRHSVRRDKLYKTYWYRSGVNSSMQASLAEIYNAVTSRVTLNPRDIVIDTGSNDSTLLRMYDKKIERVGFEPSKNLMEYARRDFSGMVINNYFNAKDFQDTFGDKKAKAITSIAMFYDLEDPNQFVEDVTHILQKEGVWIIQQNYLGTMLKQGTFDNISHEHLEYYCLTSLNYLLSLHGLEVFKVELNNVNGGSFRTYVKFVTNTSIEIDPSVEALLRLEQEMQLDTMEPYLNFAGRIKQLKQSVRNALEGIRENGHRIFIYGASTRGNVQLQYFEVNKKEYFPFACDRNPDKWGKYIGGSDIPIISEDEGRKLNPKYFFVLPYSFINEFKVREQVFLSGGGVFMLALPKLRFIREDGELEFVE